MPIKSPPGGTPDNRADGDSINNLQSPELAPYWLSAIIDSAEDAIITKTLEGVITNWNKGAEHAFGYTAEEAVGQPVTILIPAALPQKSKSVPNIEYRLQCYAASCGSRRLLRQGPVQLSQSTRIAF
jgi:PAS domain-containing protein